VKSVLLTGATGLIGSHFANACRDRYAIHALSRRPPHAGAPYRALTQLDLAGPWRADALPPRIDAVVHLAQSEHFREFPEQAAEIFSVNAGATVRLLDYARRAGARTFVLASSGGVYGASDTGLSENAVIPARGDLGFYLGTRLCSEIVAQSYSAHFSVITLRFFFAYGPGQRASMLVPRLIESVRAGAPIALQGDDGIRINPTFATDAATAVECALSLEGMHNINVAGPEILSLRQIAEAIGQAVGRHPVYAVEPVPPRHIIGDIEKMSQLLRPPAVGFRQGLERMLKG
jgi:nucleoside-diphosphate-sugar epimerase